MKIESTVMTPGGWNKTGVSNFGRQRLFLSYSRYIYIVRNNEFKNVLQFYWRINDYFSTTGLNREQAKGLSSAS